MNKKYYSLLYILPLQLTLLLASNVTVTMYDENQYADGNTIFGSADGSYSAIIDKEGTEIWNSGEDPIIYYHISNKLNNFIPAKYKNKKDKDSEYEKSKKKIIKNLSVKCAFSKPSSENIVIENSTDLTINC